MCIDNLNGVRLFSFSWIPRQIFYFLSYTGKFFQDELLKFISREISRLKSFFSFRCQLEVSYDFIKIRILKRGCCLGCEEFRGGTVFHFFKKKKFRSSFEFVRIDYPRRGKRRINAGVNHHRRLLLSLGLRKPCPHIPYSLTLTPCGRDLRGWPIYLVK